MTLTFTLLSREEIQKLHDASIELLARTGMKIGSEKMCASLHKRGAKVDLNAHTVLFPEKLVERTIENNSRLLKAGKKLHLLNGVTSEIIEGKSIGAKVSGGCEKYLDWETQSIQNARASELLRSIRVCETIPEVRFIGNPLVLKSDVEGKEIEERLRRVKTAALIAKNTTKLGSMEIWDEREIDFLVEIGCIARGGRTEFNEKPCLLTAKETISPLFLDEHSGNILLELAKRELPCTIIPMPITGLSAPVSKLGNAVVGNAEILGVMTAIQSVYPQSPVGGGTISGIMDMQTGVVSFSAPEAILQDIAIAEVHENLYGFNYLIGSGYFDAKYPNHQVFAEKTMKYLFTYLSGRYSYPVGLINSGSVFSLEQALVDIEICRYIHAHFGDFINPADLEGLCELIHRVGIRGQYVTEDHTLKHFKKNWFPLIFDRSSFVSFDENKRKDIYNNANERITSITQAEDFWEIESDRAREIDRVVKSAEKVL